MRKTRTGRILRAWARFFAWIKPTPYAHIKPTVYKGKRFRSQTEAEVAKIFDSLRWKWRYEPKVFRFPVPRGNTQYRPDFLVHAPELGGDRWFEVKGYLDRNSIVKLHRFCKYYPQEAVKLVLVTDEKKRLAELLKRKEVQDAVAHGALIWSLRRFLRLGGTLCPSELEILSGG